MATVDREPLLSKEEHPPFYQEADKLLQIAERLLEKCEQHESKLGMSYVIGASLAVAVGCMTAYHVFNTTPVERADLWVVCAWIYAIALAGYLIFWRAKILRRLHRDKHAMHSIVDVLQELGVTRNDPLSTLKRLELRVRVSRFDIGPGSPTSATGPRRPPH